MLPTFWSNTVWYILLGIFTLLQIIFILKKADNRKHVVSFLFIISGMTFCIEAIICCFLKAYNYYPMIIPQSPIDDNLAGNLFSQYSDYYNSIINPVCHLKYYWFLYICRDIRNNGRTILKFGCIRTQLVSNMDNNPWFTHCVLGCRKNVS
jgi:hypothetical protein